MSADHRDPEAPTEEPTELPRDTRPMRVAKVDTLTEKGTQTMKETPIRAGTPPSPPPTRGWADNAIDYVVEALAHVFADWNDSRQTAKAEAKRQGR